MSERHINRGTSFLFEVSAQLQAFDLDSFRRLYHQSEVFTKLSRFRFGVAPLDRCVDQGVDDFSCALHHTECTSELRIVFFGRPEDRLLRPQGSLTRTAAKTIRQVASYRECFCEQWLGGSPPLAPQGYSLTKVSFEVFIGRRALGAERYKAFRDALESNHNLHDIQLHLKGTPTHISTLGMYGPLEPTDAGCLADGDVVRIRSFDQILDNARLVALEPFPFPDQDLLREIIRETDNPSVLEMALERLEPVPHNNDIFSAHLRSESDYVRREAVLGTTDVTTLRELLSADTLIDSDLVRARIAILEQDEDTLLEVASNAYWFDAEYAAIAAMNDKEKLDQILKRHDGESTPRAITARTLVAARQAFLDRDAASLGLLLEEADYQERHQVLRMKAALESQARVPPRVFISYKHESQDHRDWVMTLAEDLRERGINALLDEWEIDLGDSLSDYMALEISRSDVMLFIITEGSVVAVEEQRGGGIKFEFQVANARRYQGADFRIVGVLRSGNRPPKHISDNLYVDFRDGRDYASALDRLVDSLLGRRRATPVRPAYD